MTTTYKQDIWQNFCHRNDIASKGVQLFDIQDNKICRQNDTENAIYYVPIYEIYSLLSAFWMLRLQREKGIAVGELFAKTIRDRNSQSNMIPPKGRGFLSRTK